MFKIILHALLTALFVIEAYALPVHLAARACGSQLTHADAEAKFAANGITLSSTGNCSTKSDPNCTSFEGICSNTVDTIIALKEASGEPGIVVTGGTEDGHGRATPNSHSAGHKVDLRHSTKLDAYIHGTFVQIATRSDGADQWKAASGNLYADEGSHWDITIF